MSVVTRAVVPAAPGFTKVVWCHGAERVEDCTMEPVLAWIVILEKDVNGRDWYHLRPVVFDSHLGGEWSMKYPDGRLMYCDESFSSIEEWFQYMKEQERTGVLQG